MVIKNMKLEGMTILASGDYSITKDIFEEVRKTLRDSNKKVCYLEDYDDCEPNWLAQNDFIISEEIIKGLSPNEQIELAKTLALLSRNKTILVTTYSIFLTRSLHIFCGELGVKTNFYIDNKGIIEDVTEDTEIIYSLSADACQKIEDMHWDEDGFYLNGEQETV